jgi:hypothetical protein
VMGGNPFQHPEALWNTERTVIKSGRVFVP